MSKLLLRSIFLIFLAMGLAACGGGAGSTGTGGTGGGTGGDTGGDTGGEEELPTVTMGYPLGHDFRAGQLEIESSTISEIGSTEITVYFIDDEGNYISSGIDRVTFSSTCAQANPATATIDSPVNVSGGSATTTYTPQGCTVSDVITVEARYDDEILTADQDILTAQGTVTLVPIQIGLLAGTSFTPDALEIEDDSISSIGSTTVTAYIVGENEELISDGIEYVSFSSTCVKAGTASISGISGNVEVTSGSATATYTAEGCAINDTITATASYFGRTKIATGEISTSPIRIGVLAGASYTNTLEIENSSLSAVGTTTVTAYLVDHDNKLLTDGIDSISFTSDCVEAGTASLTTTNAPVSAGIASTTYSAEGCSGPDTITASARYFNIPISTSGTVNVDTVSMGIFDNNGDFDTGDLSSSLGTALPFGATTTIKVSLVDSNENRIANGIIDEVKFYSDCYSQGTAEFSDTTVKVTDGIAQTYYNAGTCENEDTIKATAQLHGSELTADIDLTIAAQAARSIKFISSVPNEITVKGAGGSQKPETAALTFQVMDSNNVAMEGATVAFSFATNPTLSTISADTLTDESDENGEVTTIISSGTISGPVSVVATLLDENGEETDIYNSSTELSVASGPPHNSGINISPTYPNIRAYNYMGATMDITVQAYDIHSNPAVDGTTFSFMTEGPNGGKIEPSCSLTNGECKVKWTSTGNQPADGRITILAYAHGQEFYYEQNASGFFDVDVYGTGVLEPWIDIPEPWIDTNDDGDRDPDEYHKDNEGGNLNQYDGPNGVFNGPQCADDSCAEAAESILVFDSTYLTTSSAIPNITDIVISSTDANGNILLNDANPAVTVTFKVSDENDNPMPKGTTINASADHGTVRLSGTTTWGAQAVRGDDSGAVEFEALILRKEESGTGFLDITIVVPAEGTQGKYTYSTSIGIVEVF